MAVPSPIPTKAEIRRSAREARRAFVRSLGAVDRTALEERLADMVLPHLAQARIVAGYLPITEEISPLPILDRLAPTQVAALPWFAGRDAPMIFRAAGATEAGPWGPQPDSIAPELVPDVLLMPLVMADRAGIRIGQGGGHYDRALALLRQSGKPLTIGLAWDVQLSAEPLAPDPWDMPLDAVATPGEWIDCR